MKILVIGSDGREHAIAWKLAQSEKVENIYAVPGNGGIAAENKCENVPFNKSPADEEGQDALIQFVKQMGIDLTLVGPEDPLAAGIVDRFREAGLAIVGPGRNATRLEASKAYSKAFMKKYGVRAAESRDFSDPAEALAYAKKYFDSGKKSGGLPGGSPCVPSAAVAGQIAPLVIKADGLAAGKGVVVAENFTETEQAIASFMKQRSLGNAGASVVLEDFLAGKEVSILAAVSVSPGKKGSIRPFVSARDHKRRFEGGEGPNTGGMGAPVAVAEGYPGVYRKDDPIAINEKNFAKTSARLFIAGAQRGAGGATGSGLRTSGGRVFSVSAWGADADEAWDTAYTAMNFITFEGVDYRKDICREKQAGKESNA
jgi:phosphoribosylamine--glycine ligase